MDYCLILRAKKYPSCTTETKANALLSSQFYLACSHGFIQLFFFSLTDDTENLQLHNGHLTTLLHQSLLDDINSLDFNNVTKAISSLMSQLKDMADSTGSAYSSPVQLSSISFCTLLLASSIPLLHQYLNLSQNLLVNLLAAHRATSKLLSVLLSIFTDLASKGFCLPPEIEEGEGDGATEFEDIEGGGIGEGEGMKDVSDQIENEDQVC